MSFTWFLHDFDQHNEFFIHKIASTIRYFFLRKSLKSEGCEALCLPNLLAGGLPAGALAASIASHTLQTQNTHTLQTIYFLYLKIKNTTQHTQKLELTMGGCAPTSLVRFLCAVLCFLFLNILFEACVCFVFEVCAKRWKPQAHLQASPQPRD